MGSASIVQRDGSVTKSEWLIIFVPESAWLDIFVLKVSAIYYLALYECNSFIFVLFYCILYCCTVLYCTLLYCTVLHCTVLYCSIRTLVYCIVCPTIYLNIQLSLPDPFLVLSSFLLSSFSWLSPRKHITHTDVVWWPFSLLSLRVHKTIARPGWILYGSPKTSQTFPTNHYFSFPSFFYITVNP